MELCTPTGAAIIASCVESFGPIPAASVIASGYGAGDKSLPDRPNHLRAILFEPDLPDALEQEAWVVEANIDDMSSELCGYLMERLFDGGARDAWFSPIVMKKGRPALTIHALCSSADREAIGAILLSESTSLGFRFYHTGRCVLRREMIEVQTPYGPIPFKLGLRGERVLNASPEYEVCREAALRLKLPLKEIYAKALAAYQNLADSKGSA
jgi:uncharacterized protein (DUF111 family)